ncbi:MAG: gliding motility-associated C-terminal domain-containing protein [Saprospiraceae bacterium]|nr:gliding motility-associated C-terminal domain-containing protein [Saprospiraceae bacterium]
MKSATEIVLNGVPKLEIPTAFSPNGDATNDYFSIVAKAEGYYSVETLEVFNRSGQVVFSKNKDSRGWDGTKDGTECPSDVYIYRITVKSRTGISQKFQGEVVLLR